jgi:hypothetical protein
MLFLNDANGNFHYVIQPKSGLRVRNQVRSSVIVQVNGKQKILFGANNDSVTVYDF